MPRIAGKGTFIARYAHLAASGRAMSGRTAYLILSQPFVAFKGGRYFSLLVHYLRSGGYRVILVGSLRQSLGLVRHRFGRPLVDHCILAGIRMRLPEKLPEDALIVTDREDVRPVARLAHLRYGYELKRGSHYSVAVPYGMFPSHYEGDAANEVRKLRSRLKTMRLFLSGSLQQDTYDSKRFVRRYSKMNRYQTVSCIYEADLMDQLVGTDAELEATLQPPYHAGFTFADTSRVRVPESQWLRTLARSDFFLSCVGASMPLSHNAVESLALGVVPILSYPEFFDPPLVDGETCLTFDDCEGLSAALTRGREMPQEQVRTMQVRVAQYYDEHLDPRRFVATLDAALPDAAASPLYIGMPFCDAGLGQQG